MKRIVIKKIITTLCLLFAFILVSAQSNDTLRLMLVPDSVSFQSKINKNFKKVVDSFWFDGSYITVICKKGTIKNTDLINAAKGSVNAFFVSEKQKTDSVLTMKDKPQMGKYNLDIDNFLNIEDESIFSDTIFKDFMDIDSSQIHPRSFKYYCLIRDINKFNSILTQAQQLKIQQKEQARKMIDEMDSLVERIERSEKYKDERRILTKKQKDYYKQLFRRCEEFWNSINQ